MIKSFAILSGHVVFYTTLLMRMTLIFNLKPVRNQFHWFPIAMKLKMVRLCGTKYAVNCRETQTKTRTRWAANISIYSIFPYFINNPFKKTLNFWLKYPADILLEFYLKAFHKIFDKLRAMSAILTNYFFSLKKSFTRNLLLVNSRNSPNVSRVDDENIYNKRFTLEMLHIVNTPTQIRLNYKTDSDNCSQSYRHLITKNRLVRKWLAVQKQRSVLSVV